MPAYFFGILLQSNQTLAVSEHGDLAGNICRASEGYSIYISFVPISIHIYLPVEIGIHGRQSVRTLHHSPRFGVTHGYAAERLQAICFLQFLIRNPPALQN